MADSYSLHSVTNVIDLTWVWRLYVASLRSISNSHWQRSHDATEEKLLL